MSARFYYYPEPSGSHLVTIDLTEDLGELYSDYLVNAVDGISITGAMQRSVGRMGEIVNIQRDRLLLGEKVAYKFMALQNHLDRGYSCMFTADHTKSWAAPLKNGMVVGSTQLDTYPNPFNNIVDPSESGLLPSTGDYITIETAPPAMLSEQHTFSSTGGISSVLGGKFTIDDRLNFAYNAPAFARWYRFWPILKRPVQNIGKNIITNEGGRLFSLNLTLVPDYRTLFSFHPDEYDGITDIGPSLGYETPVGDLPDGLGYLGLDSAGMDSTSHQASVGMGNGMAATLFNRRTRW